MSNINNEFSTNYNNSLNYDSSSSRLKFEIDEETRVATQSIFLVNTLKALGIPIFSEFNKEYKIKYIPGKYHSYFIYACIIAVIIFFLNIKFKFI